MHKRQQLKIFSKIPEEVTSKFYGCGSPLPLGIEGLKVLDLGSGSGRDSYGAAALVGESGSVVGANLSTSMSFVDTSSTLHWWILLYFFSGFFLFFVCAECVSTEFSMGADFGVAPLSRNDFSSVFFVCVRVCRPLG